MHNCSLSFSTNKKGDSEVIVRRVKSKIVDMLTCGKHEPIHIKARGI